MAPGTCETMRELLLEADPAELAGEGDGPLAVHLRGCADCRAAARRLVAAEQSLAAALAESRSQHGASEAARRAMAEPRGARWRRAARWAPLAAAAAALALLLLQRDRQVLPPPSPIVAPPGALEVTPPPGRSTAVFQTGDPNIVVVWFF